MPWEFVAILLLLGVLVPWRGAIRVRKLLLQPQITTADRLALYASTIAFQWLMAGLVLWRALAHHISLEHLALAMPRPALTTFIAAVLAGLVVTNQVIGIRRLSRLPAERQGFIGEMARKVMPQTSVERLAFLALVITVALCEEFLYRGFIQAVFENLAFGSVIAGAAASATFFSVAHLYQGKRGLASTFVVGIVFSAARIWTGSLIPSMAAHFTADFAAGLIAPREFRLSPGSSSELASE